MPDPDSPAGHRALSERTALALAGSGVRSSSVRLAPTVHGEGDHGFVAMIVDIAREKGVSGHVGDGANRWPAVHRLDAARLFRLALESAPAGIGAPRGRRAGRADPRDRRGDRPPARRAGRVDRSRSREHFGWLGGFFAMDVQASSARTRELLGWEPTQPGLLDDLASRAATRASRSRRGSGGRVRGRARCREGAAGSGSPHASLPHPPPARAAGMRHRVRLVQGVRQQRPAPARHRVLRVRRPRDLVDGRRHAMHRRR